MNRPIFSARWIATLIFAVGTQAVYAQEVSGGGGVPATRVRSLADDRSVNVEEELAALRAANAELAGSVQRRPMTFDAALARVRELGQSAGGTAATAAALQALPNNEPLTLQLLAVRELARGRTTAMFLLLLAAYERDPNSAAALTDLAGVLAGLGYANEALAFLDELARRNALPSPPLDISGVDALAYLRGYTLVRLGDIAAAKPLLAGVAERQPMLAEAARLMAVISADEMEQRKYFLLGVWRHRSSLMVSAGVDPGKPEPDPWQTGEEVTIDLRSLLDLNKGERGRLPDIPYARGVTHANWLVPVLEDRHMATTKELAAILKRQVRPKGFEHPEGGIHENRGERMNALMTSLFRIDRKIRELDHARDRARPEWRREMQQVEDDCDRGKNAALAQFIAKALPRTPTVEEANEVVRPFYEAVLAQARGICARREKAERDFFAEWHLLASAIPSQVGDPAWWEYLRLKVEYQRILSYQILLSIGISQAKAGMYPSITKEPGEGPASPEAQRIGKCDGDKSASFSTSQLPGGDHLPFEVGVEMSCEGMSLELGVDTRIPGISISAEVGADNKGDFTAFIGPKASATLGEKEIAAFSGSAKGGAYVKGNRDGVSDAGVKYEIKVGGNIGNVSGAQKLDEGKVSFMPAPASGEGGFEPLQIGARR